MGQIIQEWTKWNLWKTAFKKLNWYGLLKLSGLSTHELNIPNKLFSILDNTKS